MRFARFFDGLVNYAPDDGNGGYAIEADDLRTQVDHELSNQQAGLEIYNARIAAKEAADDTEREKPKGRALLWEVFMQRHPEYDAKLWEECRALYAGGPKLLRDKALMKRLFPSHRGEDDDVYKERVARAHYFPYAGSIIDHLVAGLGADPISVTPASKSDGADAAKLPEWWRDFMKDVSPGRRASDSGKRQSCANMLLDMIREALITRRSWCLLDFPKAPMGADEAPTSLLDQERRGLLDPYAIGVKAEYVIDWQDDENGELEWALVCDESDHRADIGAIRDSITKTFTFYTRESWERYRITYLKKKPPKKKTPVPFVDSGFHAFGKVPMVRIVLDEGMWAMGKLESLAREHLNKRNAVAWAEYKALFSILYEFLAGEDDGTSPNHEITDDPDRGINQARGQGYSQIRGDGDSASFIGPPVDPFIAGRESCAEIMREMHRVMFSMALSADMSSAALGRSGDSKKEDKAAATVVLKALGSEMRDAMRDMVALVSSAREEVALDPRVDGAEKFDSTDVMAAVKEAVELLNGVPLKSPTFLKAYLLRIYKTVMGDEVTEQDVAAIRSEVETMVTMDSMMLEDPMLAGGDDDDDDDDDDEEEEEEEEEEDDRASKRAAALGTTVKTTARPPATGRVFSSKRP
jgi:hypothetical protein